MRLTDLTECEFNWRKCLWETSPEHWVWFNERASWVVVAFPTEYTPRCSVPDPIRERRERLLALVQRYDERSADE